MRCESYAYEIPVAPLTIPLIVSFLMFAFASSITPGPNNIMLMASGANFGFRATVPHMIGVIIGFGVMVLLVGFGLAGLFSALPWLYKILRVLGASYLLYLAYKIATADGMGSDKSTARPMTFLQAIAFQWINPKAWTIALVAITAYAPADRLFLNVTIVSVLFVFVGLPCSSAWTVFGVALKSLLSRPATLRAFNITMAALLVASLFPLVLEIARPGGS